MIASEDEKDIVRRQGGEEKSYFTNRPCILCSSEQIVMGLAVFNK